MNTNLTSLLINEKRKNYKCFSELIRLLQENKNFREIVISGLAEGKIRGFDEELWEKIHAQNIKRIDNFEDVFIHGANIGYCTVASKQLSYSLDTCYLCGGTLPLLMGTKNCDDGSHTWILYNDKVIDTTLMLIINKDYIEKIGYNEENRYNPNIDPIYAATKEFTNDSNIRKKL